MSDASDDGSSVLVAVRVRPRLPAEPSPSCLSKLEGRPQIVLGTQRSFTFDHVFDPSSSQEMIHEMCVLPLLSSFFQGYNATIFAYGQTGSGKTYTMGSASSHSSEQAAGIIPRSISEVFRHIESVGEGQSVRVSVSFLEVYNEEIRDLLDPSKGKGAILVREDAQGNVAVVGAEEEEVSSCEQMLSCLHRGTLRRKTAETNMNETSSRSHAIFSINMERRAKGISSPGAQDENNNSSEDEVINSNFHFVDLAGSERAKRTLAEGQRMKEGIAINYSLLVLANVISALGDDRRKGNHVPYRDSVLTRMLQHSLGGNSRTLMIACVSPSEVNLDETLNTLRYANRAKNIKNKPVVNRDPHAAQLAQMRAELRATQHALLRMRCGDVEASLDELLKEEANRQFLASIGTSVSNHVATTAPTQAQAQVLSTKMAALQRREAELASECESLRKQMGARTEEIRKLCDRHAAEVQTLETQLVQTQSQSTEKGGELSEEARELLRAVLEINLSKNARLEEELTLERSSRTAAAEVERGDAAEGDALPSISSLTYDDEDQALNEKEERATEAEQAFRISQLKMHQAVKDLSTNIELKEQLMSELSANQQRFEQLRSHYEQAVTERECEVASTNQQLEAVQAQLEAKENDSASQRHTRELAARHAERLRTLQGEIKKLKRKASEYSQMEKLNAERSLEISRLHSQVSEMKKAKNTLQRKAAEESAQFREWKSSQQREISQLRREGQAIALRHHRLQEAHSRQCAVLKRRTAEVNAVQKKLRDAEASRRLRSIQTAGKPPAAPREGWATPRQAAGPEGREPWRQGGREAGKERGMETHRVGDMEGGIEGAVERLVEEELSQRVRERLRGMQLERAMVERDELASRRDGARERREAMELQLHRMRGDGEGAEAMESETRELDDEIESLEAQLEVKNAIIMDSNESRTQGGREREVDAFADVEPRLLAELLFEKLVETQLRHHEMNRRIAGLKGERDSISESLVAAQLSQQQQQQQHDHVVTQLRRQTEKRMRMLVDGMEAELEGDGEGRVEGGEVDDRKRLISSDINAFSNGELPTTVKLQLEDAQAPVQPWQHSAHPWLPQLPAPQNLQDPQSERHGAQSYTALHRQRTARRFGQRLDEPEDEVFARLHPAGRYSRSCEMKEDPRRLHEGEACAGGSAELPPGSVGLRPASSMPRLPEANERGERGVPAVSVSLSDISGLRGELSAPAVIHPSAVIAPSATLHPAVIHPCSAPPPSVIPRSPSADRALSESTFARQHSPRPAERTMSISGAPGREGADSTFPPSLSSDVFTRLASFPRCAPPAEEVVADPFGSKDAIFAGTHTLRGHSGFIFSLASAKGQLFSASQDGTVRVWAVQPEQTGSVAELTGHHGFVRSLAVSGGGALLFSGSADRMVRVWDTHTHVQLCALPGHKAEVHSLAVHNDLLFSGSEDASIKVWNIASLKCIRTLGGANGHTSAVFALAVCGEPCMLASGSRDHTIRLWELATLEWKRTLHPPHLDCVQTFASHGNNLYSGSRDRTIKHWRLPDGALLGSVNLAHDDWVCSLAVDESSSLLVSGGRDGRIKLWRLPRLEPCGVLEGHTSAVNCLLSVSGLMGSEAALVSCSNDRTIRVWKSKVR